MQGRLQRQRSGGGGAQHSKSSADTCNPGGLLDSSISLGVGKSFLDSMQWFPEDHHRSEIIGNVRNDASMALKDSSPPLCWLRPHTRPRAHSCQRSTSSEWMDGFLIPRWMNLHSQHLMKKIFQLRCEVISNGRMDGCGDPIFLTQSESKH